MRSRFLAFIAVLMLTLGVALPAGASTGAATAVTVTGLIIGAHGSPVAGAQVELIQLGVGSVGFGTTTADGTYVLNVPKVTQGPVYLVRAWAKGYGLGQSAWSDLSHTPVADVALTPATSTIGGRVQTSANAAVAGATVELISGTAVVATQTTNSSGAYRFADQTSGNYRVRVLAKGFAPSLSSSFSAVGGQFTPADITLQSATGTVSGQVVDQLSGHPIAGSHLLVVRAGLGIVASADADKNGQFSFPLVPTTDASYSVIAWATGYAPVQTKPAALAAGEQVQYAGVSSLQLSPTTGSLAAYVTDTLGLIRSGVKVQLDRQGYGTVASGLTDDTGRIQFDQIQVGGQYRLRLVPQVSQEQVVQTDWVSVSSGRLNEFSLVMQPANNAFFGNGTVTGRVVDRAGRPVPEAKVELIRGAGGSIKTTTTDQDGRYKFTRIDATKGSWAQVSTGYMVRVSQNGYVVTDQFTLPSGRTPASDGVLEVVEDGVAVANFTLAPSTDAVTGYATDSEGHGLSGIKVHAWLQGAKDGLTATTDSTGRYQFSLATADGSYLLYAEGPGYFGAIATSGPILTPTLGTFPTIALSPSTATLTVRVTDSLGQPPTPGAQVKAFVPITGEWISATADTSGRADLDALPADGQPLAVSVLDNGYLTQAIYPAGNAGGQTVLALTPAPGDQQSTATVLQPQKGTLGGGVFKADGSPVAGATVTLLQEGVGVVATTQTDSGGHYWFKELAAGPGVRYLVRADATGYATASLLRNGRLVTPVQLDAGGTLRMDLQLNPVPQN